MAGRLLADYRRAGYPGMRGALDMVHRNQRAIAGSVLTGIGAYGARLATTRAKPVPAMKEAVRVARAGALGALASSAVNRGTVFKVKSKETLKKRVSRIEKEIKEDISKVIYIKDTKDTVRPGMGGALNGYRNIVDIADIELALAQARFFDSSTPGTLITASLASPTYTQSIGVSVVSNVRIINNYQVPCRLTYAVIMPKVATNTTPTTAWTNGLTDSGNPSNTSYLLTMKDSTEFIDTYKVKKKWKSVVLSPGEQVTVKHVQKMFDYDPSYFDTNTQSFQPKAHSAMVFYRVHGVFGHDTSTPTEQGILPAGIDVHHVSRYIVSYNSGGAAVKTIVLSQGASSSFTSGGVVSQMPIPDNVTYSIS